MLPPRISAFLAEHSVSLPGEVDHDCEGAKFHSPTPLYCEQVELAPGVSGGPKAWLCGTCRDNLKVLWSLQAAADGVVPWPVRREFGNQVRALAEKGWRAHVGASPA